MTDTKEYFSDFLGDLVELERTKFTPPKSMETIAAEIGISKGALSLYINGKREPGISVLLKIANYFKVSPDKLLGYEDGDSLDTKPMEIHAFTGFSCESAKILHKKKNDPFFIPVLNFLIED